MQEKKQSLVLWFTGIPSSGKTTLANHVAMAFEQRELEIEVLDSDDIRRGEFSGRPGEAKTIEELYKPYQEPINPEITVDISLLSIKESVELIMSELELLNLV